MIELHSHRIQDDVPNFPDEVIESWLVPMAESAGWPPIPGSRWDRILLDRPLSFWKQMRWSKERVFLSSWFLTPESLEIIQGLIDANVDGVVNIYSDQIRNSKTRFTRILRYIRAHESLPVPPVLLKTGIQYRIADGNHRIAAWLYSRPNSLLGPLCWVATPPSRAA